MRPSLQKVDAEDRARTLYWRELVLRRECGLQNAARLGRHRLAVLGGADAQPLHEGRIEVADGDGG